MKSILRNCFFLSGMITLYSLSAISQVKIHERVTIQANKLGVDSTGKYMPGQKVIFPPINKSMQTTAAMITVPESSYVTIAVVSSDAASAIDLILRSPFNQTIIPNASGNVGATWESPFFSTETVLDVGIFWVWRNYSGYEYGVDMTQFAENEYILYLEDLGDLYGPYIDYDDLVVNVRIHGKPDHLNVTVDPDSIFYGGYTDITAVAIDNEGNEMPLGDNAIMTLSAEPSSIGSFYPSNEVLYWDLRNGYVSYLADQEQSPCTQDVVVTVSGEGASGTANVVVKGTPCIVMSTSSDRIHPGESVDITMQQLDCSGNLMPYPADQYFYIWMNSDPKYGKLRDQSGNEDSFVEGVQPFKFIAADSIDVDTTVVEIEAWAWSGGGGASRIAGVGVKDTLGNPPIASTTLNATLMKLAKLEEKLKKRLAEVKAAGPVPSGVKDTTAQANTKNKLMITSEGVTDCRSVVHITITKEESELVVIYPTENLLDPKDIDRTPEMPDIGPRAYLKNYSGGEVKFQWNLRVQWEGPDGRKFDDQFPGETNAQNSEVSIWSIGWREIIRGGDEITLDVTATTGEDVYNKTVTHGFKITGLNPYIAQVKEGLSPEEQVTVFLESNWKHFNGDHDFPRWGDPHGYGLMQLDKIPPRSRHATDEEVWNWRLNRATGQDVLQQKYNLATRYGRHIRNGTVLRDQPVPASWYRDPRSHQVVKYKNATDLTTDEQLWKEAFHSYRGGVYWRWKPDFKGMSDSPGEWIAEPTQGHSRGDEAWTIHQNVLNGNPPQG
jgi:hypothetical protein